MRSNNITSKAPVALITGASSGIGSAAAFAFAEAGYDVILAARRMDKLTTVAATIVARFPHRRIVVIPCDITSEESVRALFNKIMLDFGYLNVLVNNAGFGVYGSVELTTIDSFKQNMDTNYLGTIRCTQAALPLLHIAKQHSMNNTSIVMISSIVGRRAMPNLASYCATKFAMEALSESLRIELRDTGISVSVVNPGVTQTEFSAAAKGTRPASFISSKNAMTSEQVAKVIVNAARKPVRNKYLTLAGKVGVLVQWLSPRLLDWVLLRTWRQSNLPSKTNSK